MTTLNQSREIAQETKSTTVSSFEEIRNWLESQNVKKFVIEKIAQSFMAKLAPQTRVELRDGILSIGESNIKLGENIYLSHEKTNAIIAQTQNRAMTIIERHLPAKTEKKPLTTTK